ncbi:MAG: hypothetical protein KGN02_05805 [bacterium]|nr:hypothetical protein [bacterium]
MQIISQAHQRALEFGIYRDGDNNLDDSQSNVLTQAFATSRTDSSIAFDVENTTHASNGHLETHTYSVSDGTQRGFASRAGANMSSPDTLAAFVARTLDHAEQNGAKQTWIDLVDHGAGDGGGLEADAYHGVMPMPQIAAAIAQGEAMHAREHPEDADRRIDGVVANQCLMASMGFADELSRAGVKYLAASPETMVSPGVPSSVAHDIASHIDDPQAMARAVTGDVMRTHYGAGGGDTFGPAAAFDVLDLAPSGLQRAESAIKRFNDDAARAAHDGGMRARLRRDVASVPGMVRFHDATPDMPWHADRPAIAMYRTIASDAALAEPLRRDARAAADAVGSLVLAHKESAHFGPFDGSSYRDAAGPTIHAPISRGQIDPWAPNISETHNAFYAATDEAAFAGAIA